MNTNSYLIESLAAELIKARVGEAAAHRQAMEARTSTRRPPLEPVRRPPRVRWFWRPAEVWGLWR
jgi:hypothetical protein